MIKMILPAEGFLKVFLKNNLGMKSKNIPNAVSEA